MMTVLSVIGLVLVAVPLIYLYVLAFGALRRSVSPPLRKPRHRFAVAIPAHNECVVIGQTISGLQDLDYPVDYFDIYVVADHCSDETASIVRRAGAVCFERDSGPRSGKGTALSWLFERIWETGIPYDGIVIFDADTRVDGKFLRIMDARLSQGDQVIQGQHCIANPQDGWFPSLAWAMFLVDNRLQSLGRANLGLSARNLGDSICLRTDVLRRIGWGDGLTEDYDLRLRLLLQGVRIAYEPAAVGRGEAPLNWGVARRQRERWLAGTYHSSRRYTWHMLRQVLRFDLALLDGVAQMVFPSYSTLTVLSVTALLLQMAVSLVGSMIVSPLLLWLWSAVVIALFLYPFLGLALERAPVRAYLVILTGPFFVLWRTWLAVVSRFGRQPIWVRTPRSGAS